MNNYIFNSHIDFGIFIKVNFEELSEVFDVQSKKNQNKSMLKEFLEAYEACQGGCPCSLKKRTQAALDKYKGLAQAMSNHEASVPIIKELLADPDGVEFKENADSPSFLTF
jgi:hypothetical protein